jgi:hypothetical protein
MLHSNVFQFMESCGLDSRQEYEGEQPWRLAGNRVVDARAENRFTKTTACDLCAWPLVGPMAMSNTALVAE